MQTIPVPTCGKEVLALMRQLDLPSQLPRNVMRVIADKEGRHFAQTLADIANAKDPTGTKRSYIEAICSAVAPMTHRVIKDLGFDMSLDQLIDISKKEGQIFRASVAAASQSPDARSYLEQLLAMNSASGGFDPFAIGSLDSFDEDSSGMPAQETIPEPPPPAAPAAVKPSSNSYVQNEPSRPAGPLAPEMAYESHHVYGSQCAFCFSMDTTKSEGKPTIRIEAARLLRPRKYDWANKVGFQLRVPELAPVYGVLTGLLTDLELGNHGTNNEKFLHIKDQGENIFISLRIRSEKVFALPIPASELILPITMILRQLQANMPNIGPEHLNQSIEMVCKRYARAKQNH